MPRLARTMGKTDKARPPRWLRGWRLLVTIAVTALMLVVLMLVTVVLFSGNLTPVIERAKRDGLPTTWADLGLAVEPRQAGLLNRITALMAANRAYGYASVEFAGRKSYALGTPGTELTEGFRAAIAGRSEQSRREIAALVGLMQWPYRVAAEPAPAKWAHPLHELRKLHELACEELLGGEGLSEADFLAGLAACRGFGPDSALHLHLRILAYRQLLKAVRFRLPALAGHAQNLADELRAHAAGLKGLLLPASRGEFVRSIAVLHQDPWQYIKDAGIAVPEVFTFPLVLPLVHRLGRAGALDDQRQWTLAVAACPDARGPDPASQAYLAKAYNRLPQIMVRNFLFLWNGFWFTAQPRLEMEMLATAAALDGAPWPADPHAPAGRLLRELRDVDCRLIAVYSVGRDGDDDRGLAGDEAVLLYAPVEAAVKPSSP